MHYVDTERDEVSCECRDCSSLNAASEKLDSEKLVEDENRVEDDVHDCSGHHSNHRILRSTLASDYVRECSRNHNNRSAIRQYRQIFACEFFSSFCRSDCAEHLRHELEHQQTADDSCDKSRIKTERADVLHFVVFFLSERAAQKRASAHSEYVSGSHQHHEHRSRDIHRREHARIIRHADEKCIDHVVENRNNHAQDCGNCKLEHSLRNRVLFENINVLNHTKNLSKQSKMSRNDKKCQTLQQKVIWWEILGKLQNIMQSAMYSSSRESVLPRNLSVIRVLG